MNTALVLFSGGQDSATCLAWATQQFDIVETIGFDYGQRHAVELEVREEFLSAFKGSRNWHDRLGADHLIDAKNLGQIGGTAMTEEIQIEVSDTGLPNTFVPARNLYFFTLASAVGYRRGISTLVGGMCETDFSGYPDCRRVTMDALQSALSLGTDKQFEIATPLMWIDKAQTWEMASQLGGDELVHSSLKIRTPVMSATDQGVMTGDMVAGSAQPVTSVKRASPNGERKAGMFNNLSRIGLAALVGFVATIPLANWMIGSVGTFCVPDGPCMIPV